MSELVDDMVSFAWELLSTRTNSVLDAERPWSWLATAMRRAAQGEARAAELVTAPRKARTEIEQHQTKTLPRLGGQLDDHPKVQSMVDSSVSLRSGTVGSAWDAGLRALHAELVAAGAPAEAAAEAIECALDILEQTVRRSWIHHTAYRDVRLTAQMSRTQVRALIDLLIGSRRHGAAGSAWLALRQAAQEGRPVKIAEVHPQSVRKVRALVEPWVGNRFRDGGPRQLELAF
ncbi:hypothetical protein [Jiangella rhizosphaerae]|nr:hypothetical protein [Jiangella rhizosphaerae]